MPWKAVWNYTKITSLLKYHPLSQCLTEVLQRITLSPALSWSQMTFICKSNLKPWNLCHSDKLFPNILIPYGSGHCCMSSSTGYLTEEKIHLIKCWCLFPLALGFQFWVSLIFPILGVSRIACFVFTHQSVSSKQGAILHDWNLKSTNAYKCV